MVVSSRPGCHYCLSRCVVCVCHSVVHDDVIVWLSAVEQAVIVVCHPVLYVCVISRSWWRYCMAVCSRPGCHCCLSPGDVCVSSVDHDDVIAWLSRVDQAVIIVYHAVLYVCVFSRSWWRYCMLVCNRAGWSLLSVTLCCMCVSSVDHDDVIVWLSAVDQAVIVVCHPVMYVYLQQIMMALLYGCLE